MSYRVVSDSIAGWIAAGHYPARKTFPHVLVPSLRATTQHSYPTSASENGIVELREEKSRRLLGHAFISPDGELAPFHSMSNLTDVPVVGVDFWVHRFVNALRRRQRLIDPDTTAFRILNGESDGCPGLFIDRFNRTVLVGATLPGAKALFPVIYHFAKQAVDGYEIAFTDSPAVPPTTTMHLPSEHPVTGGRMWH